MSRSTTAPLDGRRVDRIEIGDDGDSERVDFSGVAAGGATGSISRIDTPSAVGGH